MDRRNFNRNVYQALFALGALQTGTSSFALSLGDLSNADASSALKTALELGVQSAIDLLGKPGGFLDNAKVKIPLPRYLQQAADLLRNFGQGAKVDDLINTINHTAEAAVPMAKTLLLSTVKNINVLDAKNILSGGKGSVTQFFSDKTRAPLGEQFLPMVDKAMTKYGLTEKYNNLAGKLQQFGLVKPEDANMQQYVTNKSLDGLFLMIGEEEKKIRQDPVGTGKAILQKVFGAIK